MKNTLNIIFFSLLAVVALYGCKDDVEYNDTSTNPVSELLIPDDNLTLDLVNNANATQYFSWTPPTTTTAYNYGVVFYASESGPEIYRIEADDSGSRPYATIKHDDLILVAKEAGIRPEETGDIYWNVISMRGGNESQPSAARRKISIRRYAAFDDIPYSLYVFGEASEAGTNYGQSPKFAQVKDGEGKVIDGVFQIYTKLEGGKEYQFTNRPDAGDKRTFVFEDEVLKEENTTMTADDGIFRITVNFNTARVTMEEIGYVDYFHPTGNIRRRMDYVGFGHWQSDKFNLTFSDNRYHFLAQVDGTEEAWGYKNRNSDTVPNQLSGSYFNIFINKPNAADIWDWSFKFYEALNGVDVILNVYMSSDFDNYTHIIDAGDIDPIPVAQVNNPANAYTIDLAGMGTGTLNFDWNAVSNPNGPPATYEVVFFSKADMAEEIGAFSAGLATNLGITRANLQNTGAKVAGENDEEVTVYWTVRSTIVGNSALASTGARSLNIKLLTIPTQMYLLGADTEYGDTPVKLRSTGSEKEGRFEIFTSISGTDYQFAEATSGAYRTFYVNENKNLVENAGSSTAMNGLYKITLDLVRETVVFQSVDKVELFQCSQNKGYDLSYAGKGVWEINNEDMDRGDNRYFFRAYYDGNADFNEKWASINHNNDKGPGEDGFQQDGFWDIYINDSDRDQWGYSFKFYSSRMENLNISAKVYMTPDSDIYHHEVTYN